VEGLIEPPAQGSVPARSVGKVRSRSATPIILAVIALFTLPGGLLWLVGYNYNGLTGNPLTKIHPSTYLILAIYLWNAFTSGNPVGYAARGFWKRPACFLLLLGMIALFVQTVSRSSPGMAGSIDTFLGPSLLLIMMADLDKDAMGRVEIVLHVLMAVNALMALAEFATNVRVFEFVFDGVPNIYDTRSTALQGHPLENAAVTAFYVLALMSSKDAMPAPAKIALVTLQFGALVAFGGRTATVVSVVLAGLYLANRIHHALRRGRIPILSAAAVGILAATLPLVIAGLAASGFFDALMDRFLVDDGGSAASRVEMFRIFDGVSNRDLLVGPDPALIASQRWLHGLSAGIENPILNLLLYQGIFVTVLMTVAVTAFLYEVAQLCVGRVWLPMMAFVILLNSSESIASKTNVVSKFVVVMLCLYRPRHSLIRLTLASDWVQRRSQVPITVLYTSSSPFRRTPGSPGKSEPLRGVGASRAS
jgi:hypothetical protein